jgi:uncharacterized protein (TIGR04255 family)
MKQKSKLFVSYIELEEKMARKELKHKPLVEAIFELRWKLSKNSEFPMGSDPQYGLVVGRFSDKIESEYPYHEPLKEAQIPDGMIPYMVQHRFRKSPDNWPVVQLGPGLLTVNETKTYKWENFQPRCKTAVENLFKAYPQKTPLNIDSLTLRYIDAVDADFSKDDIFSFLKDKMKTTFYLPKELFEDEKIIKTPTIFHSEISYSHTELGLVTLRFGIGQRDGKKALIWETIVQTRYDLLPQMPDGISGWLEKAHDLTDDWFFKLIKGDLEKEFDND